MGGGARVNTALVGTYRCTVVEGERVKVFYVDHAYEEGAVALAIKVLSRYQCSDTADPWSS